MKRLQKVLGRLSSCVLCDPAHIAYQHGSVPTMYSVPATGYVKTSGEKIAVRNAKRCGITVVRSTLIAKATKWIRGLIGEGKQTNES